MEKSRPLLLTLILVLINVILIKGIALANVDYLVYTVPPISNKKILPDSKPRKWESVKKVSIFACPGEYEPASLVIYSERSLKNVKVNIVGMRPEIKFDIRVVKCWYQAGKAISDVKHKILTPELLLHNDGLVEVNFANKSNTVKMINLRDALHLLPFDVHEKSNKQLWITTHVLKQCPPGEYEGKIEIIPENAPEKEIKFIVTVLPIKLSQPLLDYCIYYRGKLRKGKSLIGSEWKTGEQMEAEFRDMKVHGIDNPTVYQPFVQKVDGTYDFSLLKEVIKLRNKAGIAGKPLLFLGLGTGAPQKLERLNALKKRVRALVAFAKRNGIANVYIYGIDEARGKRLKAERLAFKTVHEAGGKVFVACGSNFADLVGDLLDLPIYNGIPGLSIIDKVHRFGHNIYNYGNPQCGVEEPLTYRRNYGLLLWQKGLDGTCDYAYQHAFGNIWNDFDHPRYRDHVMAYPTINGVIPTIQWEGFREGVDDIRYLSTLIKVINRSKIKSKTDSVFKTKIDKAENLLKDIRKKDLNELSPLDFQNIRWEIAHEIMDLQFSKGDSFPYPLTK